MEYDKRQEFEHGQLDRRLTWLLTSQTILFAALAFAKSDPQNKDIYPLFSNVISCLGIFISLSIFVGVAMGILAKFLNFRDEKKEKKKESLLSYKKNPIRWGVRTWITIIALFPDVLMPIGFAVAWAIIGGWLKNT